MKTLRILVKYFKINLSSAMEYRASFLGQAVGMVVSNAAFVLFWMIAFDRIGGAIGGYDFRDVMFLWSVTPFAYGLCMVCFENCNNLTRMIVTGELDTYLLYPGRLLLNILCARSSVIAWGDVGYGIILFAVTQNAGPGQWALFLLCGALGAVLVAATLVLFHSFSFFFGSTEVLSSLAVEFIVDFSIYPKGIYPIAVRIVMLTLIPATFIAHIPLELVRDFNPLKLLFLIGFTVLFTAAACGLFHLGLKRYESGNAIVTRL